jgi:ATP-dependent Clp protease, protease subunit
METYQNNCEVLNGTAASKNDPVSLNLEKRIILLFGPIDHTAAYGVVSALLALDELSHEPIQLVINSEGGSVSDGFAIIDTMKHVESEVITIVNGVAYSMGAVIASSGDKRLAMPHSDFLLHQVLVSQAGGTMQDLRIQSDHAEKTNLIVMAYLAMNCDWISPEDETLVEGSPTLDALPKALQRTLKKFILDNDRDHPLGAAEALKYGLIDEICLPEDKKGTTEKKEGAL